MNILNYATARKRPKCLPSNSARGGLFFLTLYAENHLQLVKGSLHDNMLEPFGEKIPFRFHDIYSFVDLVYSDQDKRLYAVISFKEIVEYS